MVHIFRLSECPKIQASENPSVRKSEHPMLKFTLVSTVFNEISRLEQSIADIENQTLLPNEVIITDAGSKDGTWERLQRWAKESNLNIKLLQEHGCNVARGRNLAIAAAHYEIIVSTDFGCTFHPDWLGSLVEAFEDDAVEVVAGAFSIKSELNTTASKADFILQNGYPVVMDEYFSPSSRSIAYKKQVWIELGGYDEWLTLAADDTIFWRKIKQAGFPIKFVDKPYVFWGRHITFNQFAKEAYRYGLGDGESKINFSNTISHIIELSLRYLLVLNLILIGFWWQPWVYGQLILLIFLLGGLRSYVRAYKNYRSLVKAGHQLSFLDLLWSFYLIEKSRIQYLKGYLKGMFFTSEKVKNGRKQLQVA